MNNRRIITLSPETDNDIRWAKDKPETNGRQTGDNDNDDDNDDNDDDNDDNDDDDDG